MCYGDGALRVGGQRADYGKAIASDVRRILEMIDGALALCDRCSIEISAGREEALRESVRSEITALQLDLRESPPRFSASEFATMLASWRLAPFECAAVSSGFMLFNEICKSFKPIDPKIGTVAALLERDLGFGVRAGFSVVEGTLVIDNLVSTIPGQGYASRALSALCAFADQMRAIIAGVVEPNTMDGLVSQGRTYDELLAWYRRYGFENLEGATVYRLPDPTKIRTATGIR